MNVSNVSLSNQDLKIFSFNLQGFKAKSRTTPALRCGPIGCMVGGWGEGAWVVVFYMHRP